MDTRNNESSVFVRRSGIVFGKHKIEKRNFAKKLRREMTPAETILWENLRGGRLGGYHFRRQQIIDGFIVDFFCLNAGLVVEVDGAVHENQREEDTGREDALRLRKLHVLRFSNDDVENSLPAVLDQIGTTADERVITATRRLPDC